MTIADYDITQWFDEGLAKGATHMLIVWDAFGHCYCPVYVSSVDAAREKVADPGRMQRVLEVYCLSANKAEQIAQRPCFLYQ